MTAVPCEISAEVAAEVEKLYNDRTLNEYAVIVKCNLVDKVVELEDVLEHATIKDLKDALPDSSPRLVFYRTQRPGFPSSVLLIWYNPLDTRVDIKRTYQTIVEEFTNKFKALRSFQLSDSAAFKEEWLISKGLSH